MAWYRVFNPELYKQGKTLQKCMKSPEVQEALDKALRTIIDNLEIEKQPTYGRNRPN